MTDVLQEEGVVDILHQERAMHILQEERERVFYTRRMADILHAESHGHFTQKRVTVNMERKPSNIGRDHKAYLQYTLTSYKAISAK